MPRATGLACGRLHSAADRAWWAHRLRRTRREHRLAALGGSVAGIALRAMASPSGRWPPPPKEAVGGISAFWGAILSKSAQWREIAVVRGLIFGKNGPKAGFGARTSKISALLTAILPEKPNRAGIAPQNAANAGGREGSAGERRLGGGEGNAGVRGG
ncbi:hypothetical protein FRY98_13840 [Paenibacillus faecis]|uniref:Uncharacterized protein n=1 Tax=Paenibacillus faecis TaxID=862114 RepID=A0A5D0CPW9_9BACL|nr:hypothetical protein [Paenibacillus faecis]TYA11832.1 hypothetical protein FRY98_13840 [Paenibacillus faecis]